MPLVWLHRKRLARPGLGLLYTSPNKRFYPNIWAQNATKASIFESSNNNGQIYCRNFQIFSLDTITNVRCCKTCNCGHEVTYWITHEASLFCFASGGEGGSWNCYLYHCGPAQSVLPDLPCARKNSAWIQLKHWTQITPKGLFNLFFITASLHFPIL